MLLGSFVLQQNSSTQLKTFFRNFVRTFTFFQDFKDFS